MNDSDDAHIHPRDHMSRRSVLRLGGLSITALASTLWWMRTSARAASSRAFSPATGCILSPEQTDGPYYIPHEKVRRTITEHHPGTPLTLHFTVVDAATCKPIEHAAVDIWHCDASGLYSGYDEGAAGAPGAGGHVDPVDDHTFLRGIQRTDSVGKCEFQTIYPGWYAGRTVHIHVKVHAGGTVVHTGQLYFSDTLTDKVYATGVYRARAAGRTTRNNDDPIYLSGGARSMLAMKHLSSGGYAGSITLGVRRA